MTNRSSDVKLTVDRPNDSGNNLHRTMHQEHRQWMSEIANWQDDILEWQAEMSQVLKGVTELRKTLEEQAEALVTQSGELFVHRQGVCAHEHSIARYEQGENDDDLIAGANAHRLQSEKHQQMKLAHEATKRWQRSLVSQWEHLHKAIFGISSL